MASVTRKIGKLTMRDVQTIAPAAAAIAKRMTPRVNPTARL